MGALPTQGGGMYAAATAAQQGQRIRPRVHS
jgi:hypothetical protein